MTAVVAAVLGISGCTSAERVHLAPTQPPSPSRPPCTGGDGEAVMQGLLSALSSGRQDIVSDFFTPADRFVRWIDPNVGPLTEMPDPADGHPSLDTLRDRLNALAAGGFQVVVVNFIDTGYTFEAQGEEGGTFQADLYGRGSSAEPLANGTAVGTVDCPTGKLRMVQVGGW